MWFTMGDGRLHVSCNKSSIDLDENVCWWNILNYRLTTASAITGSWTRRKVSCLAYLTPNHIVTGILVLMWNHIVISNCLWSAWSPWPYVLEEQLNCSTILVTTFTESMFDSTVTLNREKIAMCSRVCIYQLCNEYYQLCNK